MTQFSHRGRIALEIGVGFLGTTAALLMRRASAHRDDVDVRSCMANLYRLDRPDHPFRH